MKKYNVVTFRISSRKEIIISVLHIFVLTNFALIQPLFYLLSRNATFFIARKSEPIDVFSLVIALCIIVPLIIALFEIIIGRFNRKACILYHGCVVFLLSGIIVLPILKNFGEIPDYIIFVLSSLIGITTITVYYYYNTFRMFFTFLSPAILIFPILFLFNSPVLKALSNETKHLEVIQKINATAPIVIIVFDAFSLTSIMNELDQIDEVYYPNLANLSKESTWFRNATSVCDYTEFAVPAILSGRYPDKQRLPVLSDYPRNIFTLLGGSYDLKVEEPNTKLCPSKEEIFQSFYIYRMKSLFEDLYIAYLHIILPSELSLRLPAINRNWKNFLYKPSVKIQKFKEPDKSKKKIKIINKKNQLFWLKNITGERPGQFYRFINKMKKAKQPTLYFLHSVIPHEPYRYLPSGKEYTQPTEYNKIRGLLAGEMWGSDKYAVAQGYQRYLLQAAFADKLLGAVIKKLKSIDLYDKSLIVVTADHGVSFKANDKRRPITKTNYPDIMCIPLFIKSPNQHNGVVIDRNVETVDILPTIADILDITLPWQIDGVSAIDSSLPEKPEKRCYFSTKDKKSMKFYVFEPTIISKKASIKRRFDLFGSEREMNGLFKFGPDRDLVGQFDNELPVKTDKNLEIEIDRDDVFEAVDTEGPFIPAQISGHIKNVRESAPIDLAVSVDGKICTTTRTYPMGSIHEWSVVVPERAFRKGKNDVDIFVIKKDSKGYSLVHPRRRFDRFYTLQKDDRAGMKIISNDGQSIPVISGELQGFLDKAESFNDRVILTGWAADIKNSMPADSIVIFSNGEFVYSGRTDLNRSDVAEHFNNEKLKKTGFSFNFLAEDIKKTDKEKIQIFILSTKGVASEITYPQDYTWFGLDEIRTVDGTKIQNIPGRLIGFLDEVKITNNGMVFMGWAIDKKKLTPATQVLVVCNGKTVYMGPMNRDRFEVAEHFDNTDLIKCGFYYQIHLTNFTDIEHAKIHVFAISNEGIGSELIYPKGYEWF